MEAKMENGRVMLSQHPSEDKGVIYVFVGDERKTLGVRAAQIAYDLPDGVQPDQVTKVAYVEDPEHTETTAGVAPENTENTAADEVTEDVSDDKVAE